MCKKIMAVMLAAALIASPLDTALAEEIIAEGEIICDVGTDSSVMAVSEQTDPDISDVGLLRNDEMTALAEDVVIEDTADGFSESDAVQDDGAAVQENDDAAEDNLPGYDEAVPDDGLILDIEEVVLESDLAVDDTIIADEVCTAELSESGLADDACAPLFRMYSARTAYVDSYGGQLDGDAAALYSALVNAYMTERGCGELTYTLSEPLTFSVPDGVIVQEDGKNKMQWDSKNNAEYQLAQSEVKYIVQASYDAMIYDYPEIFWMSAPNFSWSISFRGSAGNYTGMISAVTWKPIEKYEGASSQIAAFDAAVKNTYEQLNASLNGDVSSYNKVKVIHDYLCDNLVYENNSLAHTAAGVFLHDDKRVVCEGYAKAFMILCRRFGLESVLIPGGAKTSSGVEGHMWNYVRMEDGKWYLIDTTWDDQKTYISDKYFLAGNQSVGFRGITLYEERESNRYSNFSGSGNTFLFSFPVLSECKYHTEHAWGDVKQTAATCTSDASESAACTVAGCEAVYETVYEGTALGHDFAGEYTVDQEATCEVAGQRSRHCSRCDVVADEETIPAFGHDFAEEYTVDQEATCEEAGQRSRHCSRCDAVADVEVIPALGHDFAEEYTVDQEATCEEAGQRSRHCSRCDVVADEETIPALGHDFAEEYTVDWEATCEAAGQKSRHCSRCDAVADVETLPAPGHAWDAGKITKAPTCTEAGITTYTCSQCGDTRTEEIAALGHDYAEEYEVDQEATCEEAGQRSRHCSRCDAVTDEEEIPALGHNFAEEYTVDQEATCEEAGQKSRHCSRCDAVTDVKTLPAPGHAWDAGKITKAPTCTEAGITTYTCSQCGDIRTEKIAAFGHAWDAGKVTKVPTCTETGVKTYICTLCNDTKTEIVAELGHNFAQEFTIDQATTCELGGSESRHCTRCGAATEVTTLPVAGHEYNEYTVMNEPTALAEGCEVRSCQKCGDVQSRSIPRLQSEPKLNVSSLKLKVKQSTTAVKVSGLAKGDSVIAWKSSKTKTVSVTKSGKITGKKVGTAVVTVVLASGKTAAIKVKVQKTAVRTTKIAGLPKRITMKKGEKLKLYPVISPITSRQKVKYRSSNKKTAAVNGKGMITAKRAGKTKITVQSGSKKATITVTVSK